MTTTYENILYEPQKNGVLITLNRPEAMNSLSVELPQRSQRRAR